MTEKMTYTAADFTQLLRRRVVVNAGVIPAAVAMLGLAGCAEQKPLTAHSYNASNSIQDTEVPSSMLTTQQRALQRVTNFTDSVDGALEKLDPSVLKNPLPTRPAVLQGPTTQPRAFVVSTPAPTTQPAVADANSPPSSPPVPSPIPASTRPAPSQSPPQASTQPVVVAPAEPTLDQALDVLRKTFAQHPTLNTTLAMALLDTADGKTPDPALSNALSPADQQLVSDLLGALGGMGTATNTDVPLTARAAPLISAAQRWQADADLTLPKLALASSVESFGVYTPVEPKFEQGIRRNVIIYCEVANFTSKKNADGLYETRLTQQETLMTEDGLLIFRPNAESVVDQSRNRRHDFYLVKKMTIPDDLAVGKYVLRMRVTDQVGNKIALVSMPIEVVPRK